ncbi:MAG TPA: DUF805 domain-containing protein [Terriglobales bacterium]|nr:DUF805 domain-containing protein [Terriglobales bacterium]
MRPTNLWSWEGKVGRGTYLGVGASALAIKFAVDWLVTTKLFLRPWGLWFYWRPFGLVQGVWEIWPGNEKFALTMLAVALPFIWLGVTMTMKRLRDAGQPVWLVCLFFVPIINGIFFGFLCLIPAALGEIQKEAAPWPGPRALDRWIPQSALGSAVLSVGLTTLLGLGFAVAGTEIVKTYGWGLFVALPFCLGMFAVLLHSYHSPKSFGDCMKVALLPIAVLGIVLVALAIEGIICILMAAPLAIALAAAGGALGYGIQSAHWSRKGAPALLSVALLLTPFSMGLEQTVKPQASTFVVNSAIEVNAPPEAVWKEVVAFAEIPPPKEMLFRAGVAYPIRAEITGRGPGAVRRCEFSTGAFVEPIEVWDEPHLLRFGVTANPAPLNELSPYGHIQPAHLHGYFESHQGQFLLTELPGDRTRLEGTTWYSHTMWPQAYWHLWSDYIIHQIHMRVLEHIKREVEASPSRN